MELNKLFAIVAITASVLMTLSIMPAHAYGDGEQMEDNNPPKDNPPPKDEKPKDKPRRDDNGGRENNGKGHEPQHWTGVCEYLPDGRILVHTAFLHNPEIAARQCREWLEERN